MGSELIAGQSCRDGAFGLLSPAAVLGQHEEGLGSGHQLAALWSQVQAPGPEGALCPQPMMALVLGLPALVLSSSTTSPIPAARRGVKRGAGGGARAASCSHVPSAAPTADARPGVSSGMPTSAGAVLIQTWLFYRSSAPIFCSLRPVPEPGVLITAAVCCSCSFVNSSFVSLRPYEHKCCLCPASKSLTPSPQHKL